MTLSSIVDARLLLLTPKHIYLIISLYSNQSFNIFPYS